MWIRLVVCSALFGAGVCSAAATTFAPPMLDISRQCEANTRHNATAMSECVVAESEARANVLQNWSKYSDNDAERCIKAGRKTKRLPYTAMEKCLTAEAAPAGKPSADARTAEPKRADSKR